MAHLIDNSKGFNAFISLGEPAWHGLGEIFNEPITIAQAIEKSGLDYNVIKSPNLHLLTDENGNVVKELISQDSFFTYRTDTMNVLGSKLGKDYEVLQNITALNFVDDILQKGTAHIETAGVIDEGKKAFICLKAEKSIIVGSNDKTDQYILIATSHDGSMSITATPTNVRVVCNNTLTAALGSAKGAIRIRHTMNAATRLNEALKVLKLITDNTQANTDNYNEMLFTKISKEQMLDYFGNLFFNAEEVKELQTGTPSSKVLSTQKTNMLTEVLSFANSGIGQNLALNGSNELNMWYAYNAVTGYATRKKFKSLNDRANALMFGSTATLIDKAGQLAMNVQDIKPLCKANSNFQLN